MRDPLPEHDTVAVLGLGATGRGVADLLAKLGKRVIASDTRDALDLGDLHPNVELRLGGNDISDARVAVLSPGANPEWPENRARPGFAELISRWEADEIALVSEIEVSARAFGGPIVSVGGTDGKSTTASLCHHLLTRGLGVDALLGGNSWTPLGRLLADGVTATHAVVEVSAFQLWAGHRFHPNVSVMTNIAPDHLDHYAAESDYIRAKRYVTDHLGARDAAVFYGADPRLPEWAGELSGRGVATVGFAAAQPTGPWSGTAWVDRDAGAFRFAQGDEALVLPLSAWPLPGEHNLRNVLAAVSAAVRLSGASFSSVDADALAAALRTFRGLPHRVELVGERDGVRFFNDSKATNVHAALAGIRALDRPLVAIVGGVDKKLDLAPLIDALAERAHHVVVIGELRGRFQAEAGARLSIELADGLEDATDRAILAARPGDAVLLAPACSSFDMFRSFEHRGDVFRDYVATRCES